MNSKAGPVDNRTTDIEAQIGKRLKTAREHLRLSQTDFAQQVGLTRNKLANYESGRTSLSCATALKICRHFIIGELWLATGEGHIRNCVDLMAEPDYLEINPDMPFSKAFKEKLHDTTDLQWAWPSVFRLNHFDQIDRLLKTSNKDRYRLWNLLHYILSLNNPFPEFRSDPSFNVDKDLPHLYIDLIKRCYTYMLKKMGGKKWLNANRATRRAELKKEMTEIDKIVDYMGKNPPKSENKKAPLSALNSQNAKSE